MVPFQGRGEQTESRTVGGQVSILRELVYIFWMLVENKLSEFPKEWADLCRKWNNGLDRDLV